MVLDRLKGVRGFFLAVLSDQMVHGLLIHPYLWLVK